MSSGGSGAGEVGAADFFGNERFELLERLGEGAFGVVFEAYDRVRETRVALKVLRSLGPDALFYFKREFRALEGIQHPNLVRYYELFEERGRWFLTMELLSGSPFVEHVRAGRSPIDRTQLRCDEERLRKCLPQLAAALVALHAAGKVHRDVKPSNVRVTTGGRVVLLDFGLVLETDTRESTRLPRVGTASFMAPEQVSGGPVGPEADYYAVGVMLYECLTGQHPFVGEPYDVLAAKQTQDPAPPSSVSAFVPLDLEELTMALLARDPRARASGIESLNELAPRLPSRTSLAQPSTGSGFSHGFVGRVRELSALLRLTSQLEDGQARVAYVQGESGVGKTALLAEFARRVREDRPDAVVLSGRCYERETVPYKAFDGVVDALSRHLRRLSDDEVAQLLPKGVVLLAQAFPVLSRVPRIRDWVVRERGQPEHHDGFTARRRAFAALRHVLARLAERATLVIEIDDVHRADVDSLSLLVELLESAPPVLFVLCGRVGRRDETGEATHAAGEGFSTTLEGVLARAPNVLRLRLGALSESDTCALAETWLREQGAPVELALAIAREAAGQPLFVATLVHFVAQAAVRSIPSLDEALRASMSALSRDARRVVSAIALAGAPLSRDVLSRALAIDGSQVQAALDEALATRWFRMSSGELGGGIELVHERIREAVVERLEMQEKRELHRSLAEALSRTSAHAEAAALHWAEAGAREEVLTFARSAARHALSALAFGKAVRLYELALAHADDEDARVRAELSESSAEALVFAGRPRLGATRFHEAAALVDESRARDLRYRAATAWLSAGEEERGLTELEGLLGELSVPLIRSRRWLWVSLFFQRFFAFVRGHRAALTSESQLVPAELRKVDALWSMTTALSSRDPLRAAELEERHLSAALDLGEPYRLSRALVLSAWLGRTRGDLSASDEVRRARDLAQQSGHPHALALVELLTALTSYLKGHYRDALAQAARSEQRLREHGLLGAFERENVELLSLSSRFDTGDFRGLSTRLQQLTRDEGRATADVLTPFVTFGHLLADEPDLARGALGEVRSGTSSEPFGARSFQALVAHAELDLYLGDPNASARVERAWPHLERSRLLGIRVLSARARFLRARAALGSGYLMPHQRTHLLGLARREAALLGKDQSDVSRSFAVLIEAAADELSGERERAIQLFGEAALSAEATGMQAHAALARRRQGTVLGGEEGRTMVVRAERLLRDQGAVDPGRICAVLLGY